MTGISVWLVRHGKSELGFDQAEDSGLSELGHRQAAIAAAEIAKAIPPRDIMASGFLRVRQSALPLAVLWGQPVGIAEAVTEIPSPPHLLGARIAERRPWVDHILTQNYGALDPAIESWREKVVAFVSGLDRPAVIFSHYLTINALVGAVLGDRRTVVFDLDYCAVTRMRVVNGRLGLDVEGG